MPQQINFKEYILIYLKKKRLAPIILYAGHCLIFMGLISD